MYWLLGTPQIRPIYSLRTCIWCILDVILINVRSYNCNLSVLEVLGFPWRAAFCPSVWLQSYFVVFLSFRALIYVCKYDNDQKRTPESFPEWPFDASSSWNAFQLRQSVQSEGWRLHYCNILPNLIDARRGHAYVDQGSTAPQSGSGRL